MYLSGGGNLVGNGAVNARVTGDSGSLIEADGVLVLGDAASPAGFNFGGELRVRHHTGHALQQRRKPALGNLTTIGTAAPGTLFATNGLVVDFGEAIIGYGTINSTNTLAKRTIINGIAQGNSVAQPLTFTGYVKGVGTFNNVTFTGTFDPGLSATISTVGNMTFSPTNMLIMELGGTAPGSGYDQIQASGTLGLDGTLAVTLINGFNPAAGNSFNLFDWASLAGTFDTLQSARAAPVARLEHVAALHDRRAERRRPAARRLQQRRHRRRGRLRAVAQWRPPAKRSRYTGCCQRGRLHRVACPLRQFGQWRGRQRECRA